MAAGADRQTTVTLAVTGVVALVTIGVITVLYVNFPNNVETPYGVHRHAVAFFRLLWSYPTFSLSPGTFQVVASFAVLLFWAAYLFGLWTVSRLPEEQDHSALIPVILVFAVVFNAALVFYFPPILSGDVFHYAIQGRLYSLYGMNPYAISANTMIDDPFWSLTIWREGTTQYGPVWIQLSALCASLGGGSVLLTVFLFKLLAAISNLVGALLVLLLVRRVAGGDGVVPLMFYAWNPILLLESSGAAHSDAAMMALALLGVLMIASDRPFLGITALVMSAMIKYVTLLLLLFMLIYYLARQNSLQRLGLAIRFGLLIALLVIVAYAPFVVGAPDPSQLFAGMSPSLNPMPNNAGQLLRHGTAALVQAVGFDPSEYTNLAMNAAFALVVVLMLPTLTFAATTVADVMGRFGLATLIYTFLVYAGSFPWYLVCPLTSLSLAPPSRATLYTRLLTIGLGVGFTLQVTRLIAK